MGMALLDRGADINARGEYQNTHLHEAHIRKMEKEKKSRLDIHIITIQSTQPSNWLANLKEVNANIHTRSKAQYGSNLWLLWIEVLISIREVNIQHEVSV